VPAPNPASVTRTDNCGGTPTVTFVSDMITNQTCANRYTITRTYRATDACGNSATCAQTITVNDQTPPSITCPANVSVSCTNQVPAPTIASVTTSDNCNSGVTVTHLGDVTINQTCADRYTITRTYRAVDACGNSATCNQLITVNDQTAPSISCPANVTVSCASQVPAANINDVSVTDNCGGTSTVIHVGDVASNPTCANRYTITRTYRATDACGNSATCNQIITVNDQMAPMISCPINVTIECG
jgi:ribosomal protein S26